MANVALLWRYHMPLISECVVAQPPGLRETLVPAKTSSRWPCSLNRKELVIIDHVLGYCLLHCVYVLAFLIAVR